MSSTPSAPYFLNPRILPRLLSQILDTHANAALVMNKDGEVLCHVKYDNNASTSDAKDSPSQISPKLLSAIVSNIWMLYEKAGRRISRDNEVMDDDAAFDEDYDEERDEVEEVHSSQSGTLLKSLLIENEYGTIVIQRLTRKLIVCVCGTGEIGMLRLKVNLLRESLEKPFELVRYDEMME